MKRKVYWVTSVVVILAVTIAILLVVGRPFSKRTEPAEIKESTDYELFEWKDNRGSCEPLMPINYSNPQIVNDDTSEFYASNSDFELVWSNDDYKIGTKITDKPEDIARLFSSIKTRQVFYIKPEVKNIEANIGDLIVLSTLNNKIDITPDYETVDDGMNNYKLKILLAVNKGQQNLEFTSIAENGNKSTSSVTVDVK